MSTLGWPFPAHSPGALSDETDARLLLLQTMPHMPLYRLDQDQAARAATWGVECGLIVRPEAVQSGGEPPGEGQVPAPAESKEAASPLPERDEPVQGPEEIGQPPPEAQARPEAATPRVPVEALVAAADPEQLAQAMEEAAESGDAVVPLDLESDE